MAQTARRSAPARTRRPPAPRKRAAGKRTTEPGGARVELTASERALLRRACERYGAQIPAYLVTGQDELRLLRRLLRKL